MTQLPLSAFFDVDAINASLSGGVVYNDSRQWQQVGGDSVQVQNTVTVQQLGTDVRYKEATVIQRHTENFW